MTGTAALIRYKRNNTDLCPNATFIEHQRTTCREKLENELENKLEITVAVVWSLDVLPESPLHVFWASFSQPIPHMVDDMTIFGPNVSAHLSFDMILLSTQFNFGDNDDDRVPSSEFFL